jgi:sugar lactone lactonase YvrE
MVLYVADTGSPKNDSNGPDATCTSHGGSTKATVGNGGLQKWILNPTVTAGVVNTGSTSAKETVTASSGAFTQGEVGLTITDSAGYIPAGTTITSVSSAGANATMSAAATGTDAADIITVHGWSLVYTLYNGLNLVLNADCDPSSPTTPGSLATTGLYGVTGVVNSGVATLYVTTYPNNDLVQTYLYGITDTLATTKITSPGTAFTLLDSAPAGSILRGVSWVPTVTAGDVEVTTVPSGLTVTTSGTGCAPSTFTTPLTLAWTPGSTCQLSVTTPESPATTPGAQYVFSQWQDGATSTTDTVIAPSSTATSTYTYTATFTTQYQLTTSAGTGGAVSPGGFYNSGTNATITATPTAGYYFVNFTGATTSTSNPLVLPMNGPQSITANFAAQTSQTITFGALSNQPYGATPFMVSASASSGLPVSFNSQTPSICTVAGSTVTLVSVGQCTVQATQAGNTVYAAAPPVNQSFQVTQTNQTITFGALPNQVLGAAPFTVSATASSGMPVSFASTTTSVCTVSNSQVTLVAAGVCTIQATQAGGGDYLAAAPVNQSFEVTSPGLATSALLFGSAGGSSSVVLTDTGAWSASSNAPFLHISPGSASGSGNALVDLTIDPFTGTGSQTGTLTIAGFTLTVTQAGTNYIGPSPLTTLVPGLNSPVGTVVDGSGNVYFSDSVLNAVQEWNATTQTVSPLVSGLNNPSGVAVDGSGNVYFADSGNNAIKEWVASTQQISTLVSGLNNPSGVAVDGSGNVYFADSGNQAIKEWNAATQQVASLVSSGLSNPSGVGVDGNGNVYFSDGVLNVVDEWNAATQMVSTLVSGLQGPTGTAVDGSGNVYFSDSGNQAVKEWIASTQQVNTLVSAGLNGPSGVAVDGLGNVYIADTGNKAIEEILNVYVGPASGLTEPAAAGSDMLLPVLPATASLTGVFAPTSNQSWLTIGASSSGIVNFSFTANTTNSSQVATITVLGQPITVTQSGLTAQTITFNPLSNQPYGTAPFAVSAAASSGLPVSFASTTPSVCTVSGTTVVLASAGQCTIMATQAGNAVYAAAPTVTQSFSVTQAGQTITFGTLSNVPYGTAPFTVSASATSGLPVSFASTTTAVCTVSGSTVTLLSPGQCTIIATQGGNTNYAGAPSVSQSFQVTQIGQTITFGPLSNQVFGAAPFTVTATATSGLPVSFASTTTSVCTASGSQVTLVAPGVCTIQATQAGGGGYTAAAPVNQTFQVTSAALATSALLFGSAGGSSSAVLTYAGAWTASSNAPFLHISPGSASGSGSALVDFTIDPFTGTGSQTGTLTIAGFTLTVTQAGTNYIGPSPLSTLVPGLNSPVGTAVDGSGNVYFSDSVLNAVEEWNATTQTVSPLVSGLNTPSGVAVDGSGNVYFADSGNNAIKEWIAATQQISLLVSGLNNPSGVAVDGSGNVYFADSGNQVIKEWNAATQQVATLVSSGLSNPSGVGVDGNGNVYFSDSVLNVIGEWNAATQTVTPLVQGLKGPTGTAVDGSGNVYFSDSGNQAVKEWVASTQQVNTLVSAGLNGPSGVAVDGLGNVYIADTGNKAIEEILNVYVGPASGLTEPAAAGSDALLPVLPATASLTGVFTPTSNQSWLTIGTIASGVVNFSFTANTTTSSQVATITVLGQPITVTQSGLTAQTITFGGLSNVPYGTPPFAVSATASSGLTVSFASTTPAVCTVSGTTVTLASARQCTIQATQAGNAVYAAAPTVTQSFSVTQAAQTITFGPLSNMPYGAAPFALSATASSGLAVTFASATTSICTVSGSTLTLLSAGQCAIRATQAGNADYAAATAVIQSFQVTKASQTITFGALSNLPYGTAPFAVSATASSALPVSFASTTPSICTVSGTTVTLASVGTCQIRAAQAGNADYTAATAVSQSFQITKATQTITFGPLSNQVYGTPPIMVSATASSGLTVSFASTTPSTCTVSGTTVTLASAGNCTIKATQAGNADYTAATAVSQGFQITKESQTITFGPLTNEVYGTAPITVSATASSGLPVSFASTTPSICTVSGTTVTLASAGTCGIKATQAGNSDYSAATAVSQSFQITKASQTITFGTLSNKVLGSAPFTVSATASSGLPVSFDSTTARVCTVSGSTVTLVSAGTCTIRATQAGNVDYTAATAVSQSFQVTQ